MSDAPRAERYVECLAPPRRRDLDARRPGSESAFSAAFQKVVKSRPGAYRKANGANGPGDASSPVAP